MNKHKYNILPEMSDEEFEELIKDIQTNGYDPAFPVVLFEGDILDGWNRSRACQQLGITPTFREFEGSQLLAMDYVMRTNRRRNLTSQQWAAIAVESDDLVATIRESVEKDRLRKQSENAVNRFTKDKNLACDNSIVTSYSDDDESPELTYELDQKTDNRQNHTAKHKLAKQFGTNRTYIAEAEKLKESDPEQFKKLKSGETTFREINKAKEKRPKPEPKPNADLRFNEHTKRFALHGHRIMTAANKLAEEIHAYEQYLFQEKIKGDRIAPTIHNPDTTKTVKVIAAIASGLKSIEKCLLCDAKGCNRCSESGYQDKQNAEYIRKELGVK